MFTGIVQQRGVVVGHEPCDFGGSLYVDPGDWDHRPAPGDSVAVNGCCLTVTDRGRDGPSAPLRFDVIRQTLQTTTLGGVGAGDPVNLESAVTPASMLGGHLVQGHIDGVGVVRGVSADPTQHRLRIEPPPHLLELIVDKGSIAVDGVSLTVAALGETWFEVALVPTTIEATTLGSARQGTRVNLEADYIVKTVVSWLKRQESRT